MAYFHNGIIMKTISIVFPSDTEEMSYYTEPSEEMSYYTEPSEEMSYYTEPSDSYPIVVSQMLISHLLTS